jgi:hypothetical protein
MKKFILLFLPLFLITACKQNFLDTQIRSAYDDEIFWTSGPNNLRAFGMGVYNYLKHFNRFNNNAMLASATDEADHATFSEMQRFNTGAWNAFTNPDDVWDDYYKGIRHANLFLEKSENFRSMIVVDTFSNKSAYLIDVDDFIKLRAEVRFLRAFFYMELIKRYGGVPLVVNTLNENESKAVQRSSFQECVNFIVKECDESYIDLTNHYINYGIPAGKTLGVGDGGTNNNRLGRIEKPAAIALKLRALLYAASPLHNSSNDKRRWELAAAAGQQFFTDPNCVQVNFLSTNYKDLFMAQNTTNNLTPRKGANAGIIMTRPYQLNSNVFERANYPVGMANAGEGATCPSQNLIDAFETKSGKSITDPTSGYDPLKPFANRDARLEWLIVINGSTMGLNANNTARIVQSFQGGPDGVGAKEGATTTGYYLRKMCIENYDLTKAGTRAKSWVILRFAEVLLNYAEAMNEAYGPDIKPLINGVVASRSALDAINMVRKRAGQPDILAGISQSDLRQRIRNERRIELAFEEHRFFDVRRWKIAEQTENIPLSGISISNNSGILSFDKFIVENRFFEPKMYLYPIPNIEILKSNGVLTQNPGW